MHYSDPSIQAAIQRLVDEHGEYMPVSVGGAGTWLVQRHYVALHGLEAANLPNLGFEKIA